MRFSIRNLLFAVSFIGLILAFSNSNWHVKNRTSVVSISCAADQTVAVSVLEWDAADHHPSTFQRTISLLDSTNLQTLQIVQRDRLRIGEQVTRDCFFLSQNRIKNTKRHLFYCQDQCSKLSYFDKELLEEQLYVDFCGSPIFTFDSSDDGGFVLVNGVLKFEIPREFIEFDVDGELHWMNPANPEKTFRSADLQKQVPHPFACPNGIAEPSPFVIAPEPHPIINWSQREAAVAEQQAEPESNLENPFENLKLPIPHPQIPVVGNQTKKAYCEMQLRVVPKSPMSAAFVASIGGNYLFRYRIPDLRSLPAHGASKITKKPLVRYDTDVSGGRCFLARVKDGNRVIVSMHIDDHPKQHDYIDIMLEVETDTNSRVRLSDDGRWVAVSCARTIRVFETESLYSGFIKKYLEQEKWFGHIFPSNDIAPVLEIEHPNDISAMDFFPAPGQLIVGDVAGRLTQYDLSTGDPTHRIIPASSVAGLHTASVLLLFGLWSFLFLSNNISRRLTDNFDSNPPQSKANDRNLDQEIILLDED